MRGMNLRGSSLAVVVVLAGRTLSSASPPVDVETHVVLNIDALIVEQGKSSASGVRREIEVGPSQAESVELAVPWGRSGDSVAVRLKARLTSVVPDGDAVLLLESSSVLASSPPVVASREIRLAEEGSGLFEVFGDDARRLLLTLRGERVQRAVVRPYASVGSPVTFNITIERIDGDRVIPLETDALHTFVGQSVEYSFRQGQHEGLEAVRLALLPASVSGDLITIDAAISGALPGSEGTALVSHNERIVASRGATSRVSATAGTPPSGYRFQVTPEF